MIAITAVAVVVVAAGVGIGVKELNHGPGTPAYGMIPTGSTPQQDGQQVAAAFLSAWRSGNLTAAAKLTDQHAAAKAYLAANAKSLDLGKMSATTDSVAASANSTAAAPSETAKFTVTARWRPSTALSVIRGPWVYHSTLVAYQQPNSSVWFVDWKPDVVAPNLTSTTRLAAVSVAPTVGVVTDAGGENLTSYGDAGLTNIAHDMASAPPAAKVKAGLDVEIQDTVGKNADKAVPNSQAIVVCPGEPRVAGHHDQLVGRERRPQRGRRARDELDGRHPALHRRHPRDRQQRQLQRLRAHRRGRSRLLVQGHHLDRAVQQRDSEQPAVAGQLPPDVQGPGDHVPQRPE